METLLIKNISIIGESILEDSAILCRYGKIEKIISKEQSEGQKADNIIDAKGKMIAPGFIDMHMHGMCNLLTDKSVQQLEKLSKLLPEYGVTSFLAGVLPQTDEKEDYALLEELARAESQGANILGFFLEGHFLSLTGAITNLNADKSAEYIDKLKEKAAPYKLVFGISPEFPKIIQLLPNMTSNGYKAFITHTKASVRETEAAIGLGAVHATHFYDVFPYPGEKDPGVRRCGAVEAILANPNVSVDFILDGEHVDPVAVKMAMQCKGSEGVCLVTDANINAGLPAGRYRGLSGNDIVVEYEGGPARLAENTSTPGMLAGSGLTMEKAIKNAVSMLGVSIPQAIMMASYNPAKVLGLSHCKGRLAEGYDADMVLLDKDLNVMQCWIGGKQVFKKE